MTSDHSTLAALKAENDALRTRIAELERLGQQQNPPEYGSSAQQLQAGQTALNGADHVLRLIIDNFPLSVCWKDHNLRYLGCNLPFAQSAGLSTTEQIVGLSDDDMPWREFAELYRADDRQVFETGVAKLDYEEQVRTSDTAIIWIHASKIPLRDRRGVVTAVLGIFENITERKQTEEQLRIFNALIEAAPDGIGVATLEGTVTYANPALQVMMGYGTQVIGQQLATMVAPEDQVRIPGIVERLMAEGSLHERLHYQHPDGKQVPVELSGLVIRDTAGKPVAMASINRDISIQLRAEAERLALQEQVIEAQQATLRELSTPLIPVADRVVVMPIIGSVDSNRAQLILETLLEGVATRQAESAILDITGVKVVDTQVAGALLRAAQAVKLLGAETILTGISPEIAQTLVTIGADLSGITTRASLKLGIAFALNRQAASLDR